ncbi:unnamed protein product [Didymodactylos carnosus]|uniref:Glucose-fructose oxidoreductase n=1 Tax=Didymodactylos carnosus TaxID=1234261 RepID=A0A813XGW8_9BILA|nr:unnamed protein product [Didymodactylos carnosus]CAF0871376.1 unnamed protein product [Didymodactylos carnosus]CAF3525106.1 unnamed protein product [Didymodactylos carnosus]CAF3658687.1 unnamed protein product [Didymodactylos carnosus]
MDAIKNAVNVVLGRKPSGSKVRYAVVGAGNISQESFMPGVGQTSNSILTALVTDDNEKYVKLARQYNLKSYKYADFNKLLDEDVCDAIYIGTPNWMHQEFAVPALEKGYHVLLEKPMEVNEEACVAINEAQKKTGAKLMVAYRLHFETGTLTVLDRVRKGDLGEPRIFTSTFVQVVKEENHRAKHGAGPVPDLGPYPINAVRNLFGMEPIEVSAVGFKTPGREALQMEHDTVSVTLRFPGDRTAQFTVGYSGGPIDTYTIVGDKGYIEVTPCYMFGSGVKIAYKAKIEEKEESKTFSEVDQFGGETDYFSNCILKDQYPEPDGEEGFLDVRVIMAIKKALETGQTQKLEPKQRSKKPTLDQKRNLSMASTPKEFIGRDADHPTET